MRWALVLSCHVFYTLTMRTRVPQGTFVLSEPVSRPRLEGSTSGIAGVATVNYTENICRVIQVLKFPWSTEVMHRRALSRGAGTARALCDTSPEPVRSLAGNVLESPHAAGSSGLSPLGLLSPVVCFCHVSLPILSLIRRLSSD